MSRLARLLLAAALAAVFALTGLGVGAGSASATALPISQCSTTSGVILAVDFSHWGGPLLRSCGSVPTTGYTLLNQGGWQTQGTNHDGPAFICRIGYSGYQSGTKYPTPSADACNLTPPASAYWSYWHANPGDKTWSYSQLGAISYQPKNGSVDLWIFGATNIAGTQGTPQFTPDSLRAHNTSSSDGGVAAPGTPSSAPTNPTGSPPANLAPSTVSSRRVAPSSDPGTTSGASRTSAASSATSAKSSATATAPACPSARATPTTSTSRTPSASTSPTNTPTPTASVCPSASSTSARSNPSSSGNGPHVINAEPVADIKHSPGSFVPELLAGVLVLALGGGAGVAGWRRRQAR